MWSLACKQRWQRKKSFSFPVVDIKFGAAKKYA